MAGKSFHILSIQEIRLLSAFRKISSVARDHVVQEVEKLQRPLPQRCREFAASPRFSSLPQPQQEAILDVGLGHSQILACEH